MAGFLGLGLPLALRALLQLGGEAPALGQLVLEQTLGRLVGAFLALEPAARVIRRAALALQLRAGCLQLLLQRLGPFDGRLGVLDLAFEIGLTGQRQGPAPHVEPAQRRIGFSKRPRIAAPRSRILRREPHHRLQMGEGLAFAAALGQEVRQTLVRLQVVLLDGQDVFPGPDLGPGLALAGLAQGLGQPPPSPRLARLGSGESLQVRRRLGRPTQRHEQPPELVGGMGVLGVRRQHPAPGVQSGFWIAGVFDRLGVALPGLRLFVLELGQGFEVGDHLQPPSRLLQQRRRALVGHDVARRDGDQPAPGVELRLRIVLQRLGETAESLFAIKAMRREPPQVL